MSSIGFSFMPRCARGAGLFVLGCVLGAVFTTAAATPTSGASQSVRVVVPDRSMAAPPFDIDRTLSIPAGFSIEVYARIEGARFMAVSPDGALLVSNPGAGTITLLRPGSSGSPRRSVFASGLHHPHDIVFHTVDSQTYVYIAESNRVIRTPYNNGETRIGTVEPIVNDLPDASSKALKGRYGHQLKNIALHGGKLYVSIASTCNVCASDTESDPIRSAIYEYDADGGHRRLYARGLRNAEGLAFRPGTNELWAAVNNRDNIGYPYHKGWDGAGKDDFGKVMQSYVDGHPPDLLTKVIDGGNYGWPFCNANPDHGLDNMPYDRDAQLNPDGSKLDCSKATPLTKGIAAHSAPLGLSFLQDAGMPEPYRNALVIALHGCWNCSKWNGHKVVWYPLDAHGNPGDAVDLVTGWITDANTKQRWGRPVDAVPDGKGGIYISDDYSGTVYLLKKKAQ
jgi:glucose/arabinose dehydrogenase